jgi:putative protein kinase ArgK-like GTPase of G3E family
MSDIRIDQLTVRVTGLSRADAQQLGYTLAARLSRLAGVSSTRAEELPVIRVNASPGHGIERLSDEIAREVRRQLE